MPLKSIPPTMHNYTVKIFHGKAFPRWLCDAAGGVGDAAHIDAIKVKERNARDL
jgi:hypothetical protein